LSQSLQIVSAPTLREQVSARLREAIAQGELPPGRRLIERELCELMRVSRTSIREALRELESEGLITTLPNRGPIVAVMDPTLARSIYEVRISLEVLATRLFTKRANEKQMVQLESAYADLKQAYASKSPANMIAAKAAFYRVLLEGAANEIISQMLKSVHIRVSQLRMTSLAKPDRAKSSLREIKELVAAIKARDAELAASRCARHLENAAKAALGVLGSAASIDV
jgi:GntR family transcriptional regulator, trigonelline degradation regulator